MAKRGVVGGLIHKPTQKQEVIYKSVLYVVILIGVICVMTIA